ncbi:putative ABC transport system permease protein [Fodinibius roseus]|uniref:Putative ABC transport system permease protein n=1 Tax=Fodinibius roseus TaxID=1194090 RepID=A0A1M4ZS60_9BACT|nr:ABC transporter permease [Fodinibius roseus]SHF20602.1 putative ABC transport system permease protein [Fodinibius roseus]
MLQIILYNLDIALDAIRQNAMRSFLTSLGIIFGVASVIAMLAIGRGAQEEVLSQMKLLGTNNVIIEPVIQQVEGEVSNASSLAEKQQKYSPGLTLADMESIKEQIPQVENVSPEIIYETSFIRGGRLRSGKLVGVNDHYFGINNFEIAEGNIFKDVQLTNADPVCVIGSDVKTRFFAGEDPVGQKIKAGNTWLTVTGVLKEREMSTENIQNLGIRNYNLDIYVPVTTALLRYKNRAMVTGREIQQAAAERNSNNSSSNNNGNSSAGSGNNYHQIDKMIVQVTDTRYSVPIAEIARKMLQRRHNTVIDFEVIVPELLLQQERRTQEIFNIVLSSIASISLIVGGIGIMNIMLASVVERYREIGVRRAVGAHERDIQLQFLTEALAISISGGIIGIMLGIAFSYIIELTAGVATIVTLSSIFISFGVAMAIGVIFGFFPAQRAAEQDPVHALRHE